MTPELAYCETIPSIQTLTPGWVGAVVRCYYCGRKTELYQAGEPTCINCADKVDPNIRSVHAQLFQELLEATSEFETLTAVHDRITSDIPTEMLPEISIVREKLTRAHSRLTNFLDKGIVPEDLR